MPKVSEKQALVSFENAVQYAKSRQSKWHRLAKLFVLFMNEHPNSKTTKKFLLWLQYEGNEWNLNDLTTWLAFYNVISEQEFISLRVDKEDMETFMNFLKERNEKLWKVVTEEKEDKGYQTLSRWF